MYDESRYPKKSIQYNCAGEFIVRNIYNYQEVTTFLFERHKFDKNNYFVSNTIYENNSLGRSEKYFVYDSVSNLFRTLGKLHQRPPTYYISTNFSVK